MIGQILYIHGFSLLLLGNVYAVYWNETDFSINGRDSRRIRNKLVTFDTLDTDIELAFQFNVPFVAVPTERSIGNVKNSIVSFLNINLGSVALAGVMILFGSLTSFLWTTFLPKSNRIPASNEDSKNSTDTESASDPTTNIDDSTTTVNEDPKSERVDDSYKFMNLMDILDATINPTVCVQQYICSVCKSSTKNLAEGSATSSDKIIAGIFEAPWILDTISGTAIHDAIRYGELAGDCLKKFGTCGFGNAGSEELLKILLKSLNVFK